VAAGIGRDALGEGHGGGLFEGLGLLATSGGVGNVHARNWRRMMTVQDNNWEGSAFNVLEKLDDENSTVVGTNDHAWEVRRNIKCLV
jgi:hypothetical protein